MFKLADCELFGCELFEFVSIEALVFKSKNELLQTIVVKLKD